MARFVLVHGGFVDSTYWGETRAALEVSGHEVVLAELPSTGPDPAALGGLADDVAEVRRLLDGGDGRAVLVGHSYGGLVLTEIADHPGIACSVYVSAFWPARGQGITDMLPELLDWMQVHPGGAAVGTSGDPEVTRRGLAADLDAERWRPWHDALGYSSLADFAHRAIAPDRRHPVTYLICQRDAALVPSLQEGMAARADRVARIDTSHSPMLVDPRGLARLLEEAASAAGPAEAAGARGRPGAAV
ncbi:alpha/beta fold hydrolase [Actinomycetospora cinnamomea]|uniref:Pimeloyl-ACP methyl ester carboxylesterase n=1 Tax=Actinomycetospora cinnamomea TaxID=663609 RepID=A0A2U1F9K5_9PSEU|nr:alpha/beta hydrolase [Actinomycetospora cinnamomea]PVZ08861.1 pimeloyl-ACP methyl ester carboxylesterase [Actinomycetospora cinnamomea]